MNVSPDQRLMVGTADAAPLSIDAPVDAPVNAQGDGDVTAELGLGGAQLAVAIVKPLLYGPHLGVRHTTGRPGSKTHPVTRILGQKGQVLQAETPAFYAVAGRTKKSRAGRLVGKTGACPLLQVPFFWPILEQVEAHALGLRGQVGGHGNQIGALSTTNRRRSLVQIDPVEALTRHHAMDQASVEIHDLVGIGQIPRQFSDCTFNHAFTFAQMRTAPAWLLWGRAFASKALRLSY